MIYRLYNYNGKKLCETKNIKEMNDFIQNDGADYNIINMDSYENDIRIYFESGSQLFFIHNGFQKNS